MISDKTSILKRKYYSNKLACNKQLPHLSQQDGKVA